MLLALDESLVERSRLGAQPLVAVSQRGDVLLDDLREQRLGLAVADGAVAVARLDLLDGGVVAERAEERDQRAGVGVLGLSGGVESVTIRRIASLMTSGPAMRAMVLP